MKFANTVGCFIGVILFNIIIGAICTNYLLFAWFAKDIPWYADSIIGLFLGELVIPASIITYILKIFGVI